jgi:hypothetical protein
MGVFHVSFTCLSRVFHVLLVRLILFVRVMVREYTHQD